MNFITFFERTDPDELYNITDPSVITFALFPKVGYIYTYNQYTNGEYAQVNHSTLYSQFPGKLIGPHKLQVGAITSRITYDQVYDKYTKSSKKDAEEMEKLKQIHHNPVIKNMVLPKINKAADVAQQKGYNTVAQMRASKIIGDSENI